VKAQRVKFLRDFTRFVKERSAAGIVNAEIKIQKTDLHSSVWAHYQAEMRGKEDELSPEAIKACEKIIDALWKDYMDLAEKWANGGLRRTWGSHPVGVKGTRIGNDSMLIKCYGSQTFWRGKAKGKKGKNLPTKTWVDNLIKSFRRNVNKPLEAKVNTHNKEILKITAEHGTESAAGGGQRTKGILEFGVGDKEGMDPQRMSGGKGNVVHTAMVKALKLSCSQGRLDFMGTLVQDYMDYVFDTGVDRRKTPNSIQGKHTIKIYMVPNSAQHGGDDKQVSQSVKRFFAKDGGFDKAVEAYVKRTFRPGDTSAINNFNAASPKFTEELRDMSVQTVLSSIYNTTKVYPDMRLKVNKKMAENIKVAASKSKGRILTKAGVVRSAVKKETFGTTKKGKKPRGSKRAVGKTAASPIALRNLLNEYLPQMVASKMTGPPTLQFRTGRFANSARVENVNVGPRGGIDIDYTYMRDPYETFEPGNKQGSTYRDPKRIIGTSIRELAQGMLGRQPRTVRRN
tara:strand:- start:260 stop:1795 length:1536 start_codon:yes stop_codon:yes gene_type:complete